VTVVFDDGMDLYFARQLVLERLVEVRERLPAGLDPVMAPVTTGLGEIYQIEFVGGMYSLDTAGVEFFS
jgi:cobalt-zinc-cadmium resistance protein CzcA